MPEIPFETAPLHGDYAARCEWLIEYYAHREARGYLKRIGFIEVAANLHRGRATDDVLAHLDRLLADPHGDMFWMYPMVFTHYVGRDVLPAETLQRMRDLWRTYTPYRGDTENHWAMYYASMYLMAQLYPDDPADSWFNGLSSQENMDEAEEYLLSWMDLTTTIGQGEYDSPHYLGFFLTPMALLYGFAEDPVMRKQAQMMLDYLIADFAVDTLDGLYAGAFSRIYPEPTLERWQNSSTSFAWLLFGNTPFRPHAINIILPRIGYRPHGITLILAISGYEPPAILQQLATDRSQPYVQKELKRTRHRLRYSEVRNLPVYKTMYMAKEYAVGSTQGGLLQPIQQHTWEVQWATEDPSEGFNVLFTLHPYSGELEMGMYFTEPPRVMMDAIAFGEKSTYPRADKWTGGSPFEQIFQHEDTVIALYDIPPGSNIPHISGYFSRTLQDLETDDAGWIFARGGKALIAYYPLAPYEWQDEPGGDKRLHSPHRRNGAVVQVAPAGDYDSFDAFKKAILALPLETGTEPVAHVRFQTLRGAMLEATYDKTPIVNGEAVDYDGWKLFDGPFLYAERGSKKLDIRHGTDRRLLDFETLTITDETAETLVPNS